MRIQVGVAPMLLSMAVLVANDAIIKVASESLPPSQLIFVRGICASLLLFGLGLVLRIPLPLRAFANRRLALRSLLDALATLTYTGAIVHVPLANATAINMATPLVITLMAALFLGEHVSLRRLMFVIGGFGGVLLILQPAGEDFNAWALLMLLSAVFTAGRDLVTRTVNLETHSMQITLATLLTSVILSAGWGMVQEWPPLQVRELALLASAAILVSCGYFLMIVALRKGDIAVVAPFRYSALVFSAILGYAIWGSIPNALAWMGMGFIVLSGIQLVRAKP